MKFQLLPMMRKPEPSAEPVIALYIALVAAAAITAATALLLGALHA